MDNTLSDELLKAIDKETRELFGEEEAAKLRIKVNERLKSKGLKPVNWTGNNAG